MKYILLNCKWIAQLEPPFGSPEKKIANYFYILWKSTKIIKCTKTWFDPIKNKNDDESVVIIHFLCSVVSRSILVMNWAGLFKTIRIPITKKNQLNMVLYCVIQRRVHFSVYNTLWENYYGDIPYTYKILRVISWNHLSSPTISVYFVCVLLKSTFSCRFYMSPSLAIFIYK